MVAAVSTAFNTKTTPTTTTTTTTRNQNPTRRRPLLPSEPDNALAPRRPNSREVTSRYLYSSSSSSSSSFSTAKRSPSPLISRPTASMTPTTPSSTIKRSQSVERRWPASPRANSCDLRSSNRNGFCGSELSNAQKMLITSRRSLSVSFQGESFTLQVSKEKPAPSQTSGVRKSTPERRKATPMTSVRGVDQAENSRPVEQQRWPARLRVTNSNSMSSSMDFADDRMRSAGSRVNVVRPLQSFTVDNRLSTDSRLSSDSSNLSLKKFNRSDLQCDPVLASDSESVSSGSTSEGSSNAFGGGQTHRGPRGVLVAARFRQESNNNRDKRQPEPVSPVSKTAGMKGPAPPKLVASKRLGTDSLVSSPKEIVNVRGQMSPVRSRAMRAPSPGKFGSPKAALSPMKGMSPSRVRNTVEAVVNSNLSNTIATPSILSFSADIRRGGIGANRIVEVHLLRLLYNRLLQWRLVNARADAALSAQKSNAEQSLLDVRLTTSKLRESVRSKKTELQWLRQHLKLISILNGQMLFLEELELMDQEYSRSLLGGIEALRASTLRLPVVGGARADVHNVKDAICSAVDVMQAMASSICLLLSKVGEVNSLVGELANVAAKEHTLLDECKYLFSAITAMQVKECTLRTHILQLKHAPSSSTTKL